MPKPRYDEQKDESRHGAANQERCLEMENKHGWELKNVEYTQDSILSVDCIFDGYCEFPLSYMDLTQGDYLEDDKDA